MKTAFIIVIAAAFSIFLGKALDHAPIPKWAEYTILAAITLAGVLLLKGI